MNKVLRASFQDNGNEVIGRMSIKENDGYVQYDIVPKEKVNVNCGFTEVLFRNNSTEFIVDGVYNHPEGYQIQASWDEDEDGDWLEIVII